MATMFHMHENTTELKMHSPERELVIRPMAGKKPDATTGLVDTRIFKGENSIKAIMGEDGLWTMKYQHGILPEPLKCAFTSLSRLLTHTRTYLGKRNLEIVEVKDIHHGA